MFAAFGCFISIYYLPLYFQFTRGATAMQTSVYMLPFILFLSASVLLNGHFMSKTGYYYPWYIFGSALQVVGAALLCELTTRIIPPSLAVTSLTFPNFPRHG